ncbi:MAG: TlpA family protein disulfide reductase [Cytophagales bacterium]|nr:TlpA family protein disulfide reductase [Armatimonadota bacterium]
MRSKQIPAPVFILSLMAAILIALFVLGKMAPESAADTQDRQIRSSLSQIEVPPIEGEAADGSTFRLSDHKGKVVLLNFWATWCGPCILEIPDLIALQNQYGPQGFVVVGLAAEQDPDPKSALETIRTFAAQKKLNYPVLVLPEGVRGPFGGVAALPTSFLINREGKVVYAAEGVDPAKSPRDVWAPEIEKAL